MKRFLCYMPAVVVAIAIALLSLWENPQLPLVDQHSDKFWHTLMYIGLAFMLLGGMLWHRSARWKYVLLSWVGASLYGGLMEVLQAYCTRTRSGDWYDFAADMVGAAIGVAAAWILYALCTKRKSTK